ncbi:MAG: thioredoxin family protein [Epsilonproteobacteria bacterium]|nr:thioredoxin family protein [Campylobacterota bacterium]MBD3839731.1 thioredoxin family protein [Campylobacterota bacterium]
MKRFLTLFVLLVVFIGCSDSERKVNSFEIAKSKIGKEAMVLEIGSSNCHSCIEMKKIITELKTKNPNLPLHIVDVYDDMKSFDYFKIQMIPTQIVYDKNGTEVYRHIGGVTREELLELVNMTQKTKT